MFLLSRKITIFFSLIYFLLFSPSFALVYALDASSSASPSASATATSSPSATATPTPSASATSSPAPSASSAAGATTSSPTPTSSAKGQVLGAATTLGSTSSNSDIMKWLFGAGIVIAAFLIGIKILRTHVEE